MVLAGLGGVHVLARRQHGAVVEELTALWTSHESAYAGGGPLA
jgi:hypothetical protein